MCRRIEPLFAYYVGRSIGIDHPTAALDEHMWGRRALRWFRCKQCGCFTHHYPAGHEVGPEARAGINLRLADPADLLGIEVKLRDGASSTWNVIRSYRFGE
jgi:hypothetical protein